jgi:hypothetical protein
MGDELEFLRQVYEQALASYESVCLALHRHMHARTPPTPAEIKLEQEAKAALDTARRAYLDAWKP